MEQPQASIGASLRPKEQPLFGVRSIVREPHAFPLKIVPTRRSGAAPECVRQTAARRFTRPTLDQQTASMANLHPTVGGTVAPDVVGHGVQPPMTRVQGHEMHTRRPRC